MSENYAKAIEAIAKHSNSHVRNYVLPGLTSSIIVPPSINGCVRLFEAERTTHEFISPHSHRFDFWCLVLRGRVVNTLFHGDGLHGEPWTMRRFIRKSVEFGEYINMDSDPSIVRFRHEDTLYHEGDIYSMQHHEIHSIRFSKGTRVLFFEGKEITNTSKVLTPMSGGKHIDTFKTEPWMFEGKEK